MNIKCLSLISLMAIIPSFIISSPQVKSKETPVYKLKLDIELTDYPSKSYSKMIEKKIRSLPAKHLAWQGVSYYESGDSEVYFGDPLFGGLKHGFVIEALVDKDFFSSGEFCQNCWKNNFYPLYLLPHLTEQGALKGLIEKIEKLPHVGAVFAVSLEKISSGKKK